jgi:phosphoribosylanthranilate isomerase
MKLKLFNKFAIGLACAILALPAMAQEDELKDLPGYVNFGDLTATYGEPKITINLGGTMLNFVGMMSSKESPETSEMISKLKGIRVQVYGTEKLAEGTSLDAAMSQFNTVKGHLKSDGWEPVVSINEDDERVLVYMKMEQGNMEGMTVMVVNDEEAVFVNIIGQLNPAELGKVMESFDVNVDVKMD